MMQGVDGGKAQTLPDTQFKALGLDAERLSVVPGKELGGATYSWGHTLPLEQLLQNKHSVLSSLLCENVGFLCVVTYRC